MKKNLLRYIALILTIVCTQLVYAETIDLLLIKVGDGEATRIALNEKPSVTFQGGDLVVTTTAQTITLDGKKLINFTFANAAGIEDLKLSTSPTFYWDKETLKIFGLNDGETVSLYTVDGMTLYSGNADASGYAEINIAVPAKVMIVKTQSRTIKFSK